MAKSTLALKKADDLFEKSSMSFGDHLEELRRALVKCTIWLAAGLVIGLPMASSVVTYMQTPLEKALREFYKKRSIAEMKKATGEDVSKELTVGWSKKKR